MNKSILMLLLAAGLTGNAFAAKNVDAIVQNFALQHGLVKNDLNTNNGYKGENKEWGYSFREKTNSGAIKKLNI